MSDVELRWTIFSASILWILQLAKRSNIYAIASAAGREVIY